MGVEKRYVTLSDAIWKYLKKKKGKKPGQVRGNTRIVAIYCRKVGQDLPSTTLVDLATKVHFHNVDKIVYQGKEDIFKRVIRYPHSVAFYSSSEELDFHYSTFGFEKLKLEYERFEHPKNWENWILFNQFFFKMNLGL